MKKNSSTSRISYYKKPEDINLDQWQYLLRKQFGEENPFTIRNLGTTSFFSDFQVYNPITFNSYKVAIRSLNSSKNFCTCLDFKTNRLGICKHIAAVTKHLSKQNGYNEAFNTDFVSTYTSIYIDYSKGREIKIKIGTEKTSEFLKLSKKYFDENNSLQASSFLVYEKLLQEARSIDENFRCYEDALDLVISTRNKLKNKEGFEKLFKEDSMLLGLKDLMKIDLFPYQIEGIKFASKAGRCLIADDMGLGKTIQAIAVAELYKKFLKTSKILIVAPTSLKYQWKSEIEKFSKSKVEVIEGSVTKRREQYLTSEAYYLVTSYNTMANDINFLVERMELDMVILDEAQRIKNWKTKVSKAIKKLNSPYAIVLTGTPLENKLEELYSIMQFVDVYKLGPMYSFLDYYQIKNEATSKVIGYKNLNKIGTILEDTLLRRTKKEVLKQLPERTDKNLFVPMTKEQQEFHDEFQSIVSRVVTKWKNQGYLSEADRQRLILSLSKMRMVCDSTYILDQKTRNDTKIDELMSILDEYFDSDAGKVVVFSQWERMTRLVAAELEERNIDFEYLHGGIPSEKRKSLLDNFRENPKSKVFLSTDAGGVGLNLQSANMVINLDIPWNPAVLEQRIARVYRLGQNSNVSVINLISTGTIEHRMLSTLKFKSALAEGILDGGDDTIFLQEDRFKEFMESISDVVETTTDYTEQAIYEEEPKQLPITNPSNGEIIGDDDIEEIDEKVEEKENNISNPQVDLLNQGISFFGSLFQTLQSPESTKDFVKSITKKDENGKTYVHIPIENEEIIENGLKALSGFLQSLMNKK